MGKKSAKKPHPMILIHKSATGEIKICSKMRVRAITQLVSNNAAFCPMVVFKPAAKIPTVITIRTYNAKVVEATPIVSLRYQATLGKNTRIVCRWVVIVSAKMPIDTRRLR
jgi:hypothetical protein